MEAEVKLHQRLKGIRKMVSSKETADDENPVKRSNSKRKDVTNEPVEEAERFREEKGGRFETERGNIYVIYEAGEE